jgi:hypothetical protein
MFQEVASVRQGKLAAGRGIGHHRGEAATPQLPADDTKKILLDESDPTKFVIIGTGLSAK